MSRFRKAPLLCLIVGIVSACNSESAEVASPDIPTAGVRFINAVPDTGLVDFRFVDIPENSAHFAIPFRNNITTTNGIPASTMIEYKNTQAGSQRHFKVFMNSTDQVIAQTVLHDATISIEAGHLYSIVLWGYANPSGPNRPAGAPALSVSVIDETVADPGNQVALRVVNTSDAAIDASFYPSGGAVPGTPSWASVGALSTSSYATTAPGDIRYNVRAAGTATNLFADALALRGSAAVTGPPGPFDAIPGTTVAGSAVSAIVWPRSVAGSQAPQGAAFAVPAISYMWDRRPPRPPGV